MTVQTILDDLALENISAKEALSKISEARNRSEQFRSDIEDNETYFSKEILAEILSLSPGEIFSSSNLIELGIDSIALHQLIIKLEEYQIFISIDKFISEIKTVSDLDNIIKEKYIEGIPEKINKNLSQSHDENIISDYIAPDFQKNSINKTNEKQSKMLREFFSKYKEKTKKSYDNAIKKDKYFSDSRLLLFFTKELKSIWYPILYQSSLGAYITDIDGNQYLDIASDFGVNLFGHKDKEIEKSFINQIIHCGGTLSLNHSLISETAELFCKITGNERVSFCQSGSESVMLSVRIARTYTNKKRVVLFKGSYHGLSDGMLTHNVGRSYQAKPKYLGITQGAVEDVISLSYIDEESLVCIEKNADSIAAVLVEPIQSRYPDRKPMEFLTKLRKLCTQKKIILIFDEMITGFRVHQRGVQGIFNIQPDLSTYGKIICGGLAGGIIAGKAEYMSAIDGGTWDYSDDSLPRDRTTFMGATHTHNPYMIAAIYSVLNKIEKLGNKFYTNLNQRTENFVIKLNKLMKELNVPISVIHFGSLFRFKFSNEESDIVLFSQPIEKLLFGKLLQYYGINYVHQGNCFLTAAHTDKDLEFFYEAVTKVLKKLIMYEFITPVNKKLKSGRNVNLDNNNFPLSYEQQSVWINTQLETDYSIDTIPICLSFSTLDLKLAEKSINHVIKNNPMLRAIIINDSPLNPRQTFLSSNQALINIVSPENVNADEVVLFEKIKLSSKRPINLTKEFGFRVESYRCNNRIYLVFIFHHLFVDGYSINIFLNEFLINYKNLLKNSEILDQESKVTFINYVNEQKNDSDHGLFGEALKYWSEIFTDNRFQALNLPYDASSKKTPLSECVNLKLPSAITEKIYNFCNSKGTSLFNFFSGVFGLYLAKLCNETQFLVAFPTNPKERFNKYKMVMGHFINQLPLVFNIDLTKTFIEYLDQVKHHIYHCIKYQSFPYIKLIEHLKLSGKMHKLIRVAINIDLPFRVPAVLEDLVENAGLTVNSITNHTSNTDLGCIINEDEGDITISFSYNSHLLKKNTVEKFLEEFQKLILMVLDGHNQSVPLETYLDKDSDVIVDNLVLSYEKIVEKNSHKIALECLEQQYSYDMLNKAANRFSRFLRSFQVIKENLSCHQQPVIALCFQRSIDYVIAVIACLKIKAIFLPIDPEWPLARKYEIIKNSQALLFVHDCSSHINFTDMDIATHQFDMSSYDEYESNNLEIIYEKRDNVYIIYTSGSTGSPKGVVINNLGLLNTIFCSSERLKINGDDILLQFSSIAFDASIWEIFSTLLSGSKLVVPSNLKEVYPGSALHKILLKYSVTTALLPPSVLSITPSDNLQSLTKVISGGEKITQNIFKKWKASYRSIYNAYGPTEVSILCTLSDPIKENEEIALGDPLNNMELLLLDDNLKLCNLGEIYVSGVGLSEGYWKNNSLTQEGFVIVNNKYFFKTGDRAEEISGKLYFRGRIDQCCKIRGNRVDLGEIENCIGDIFEVKQSIVIAMNDYLDAEIIAFVVLDSKSSTKEILEKIKNNLSAKLPKYMQPSQIINLKKFPLSINGKIDVAQLREKFCPTNRIQTDLLLTSSAIDMIVKESWSKILQIPISQITPQSDFFDMGGNSLMVVSMVNSIKEQVPGIDLSIADVFENSSFTELIDCIKQVKNEHSS